MAAPKTNPTAFNNTSPPWSLALLDADFANLDAAISKANNYGNYLVDTGVANAYVVTFPPTMSVVLSAGLPVQFVTANSNSGASTLNVNGLGAVAITKNGTNPLAGGEIVVNAVTSVMYDGTQFQLLGGASGSSSAVQIQPITVTVPGTSLMATLQPTSLDFRQIVMTSGLVNARVIPSAISATIPLTATLGTTSGYLARIAILAIDFAGLIEIAFVNLSGGNNLDETTLINTTAIGASSNSNNVIYSTTARTGVPFRVVGFVDLYFSGGWYGIVLVQGIGGQALAAMSSLGYGQTWQNVTGSRVLATTYYNTTGRPIMMTTYLTGSTGITAVVTINGVTAHQGNVSAVFSFEPSVIIPPGASYVVTAAGTTMNNWSELR